MENEIVRNMVVLFLYISVSLMTVFARVYHKRTLLYVSKPLMMPCLLLFYLVSYMFLQPVIIAALFFAWTGDILLLWYKTRKWLIAGMHSFLVVQLLYIVFMFRHQVDANSFSTFSIIFVVVFLFAGIYIYKRLYKYWKELKIPVLIYIFAELCFSYLCFVHWADQMTDVSTVQLLGSLLFLVSDTIMAFDTFRKHVRKSGGWILGTYATAQLFILVGFMNW